MKKIEQSENLIRFFDKEIKDLKLQADGRKEIVVACLDIALEHQKAIILLIAKKHFGSASALLRVLFEAWVRSLWFEHCSTEKELVQQPLNFTNNSTGATSCESNTFQKILA